MANMLSINSPTGHIYYRTQTFCINLLLDRVIENSTVIQSHCFLTKHQGYSSTKTNSCECMCLFAGTCMCACVHVCVCLRCNCKEIKWSEPSLQSASPPPTWTLPSLAVRLTSVEISSVVWQKVPGSHLPCRVQALGLDWKHSPNTFQVPIPLS